MSFSKNLKSLKFMQKAVKKAQAAEQIEEDRKVTYEESFENNAKTGRMSYKAEDRSKKLL